jgi:tetratricopeptide (TPR) repeat protein
VIAALAEGCLHTELLKDSARLYGDAIALHVRTAPRRGVGDGVLCTYYRFRSGAYSRLGRTDEAVDAAAGAIVSWGRHISQRQHELENLFNVLDGAHDLEDYVARLDDEARASGMENAIVRKALGRVYLRRESFERAALQLSLALRAQPDDVETHQLLTSAYDGMRRPDLAADALLAWSRTAGHELGLFEDLGRRLVAIDQLQRSERALTMLVELSPHESEGHQKLAEIRERQARWEQAADHWRHVTRIRSAEPTGYLGLARSLIRQGRFDEAREFIQHLRSNRWPEHFGDVQRAAEALLEQTSARG